MRICFRSLIATFTNRFLKICSSVTVMPGPIRSLPPPSKRRKVQQDSGVAQSIQQLEEDLTDAATNNGSLNPLADLLDVALKANGPQDTSKAIYALYRVFVVIISNDKLSLDGDDAAKVVKAWIWERLNSYVEFLGGLLKDEEKILRVSTTLLRVSVFQSNYRYRPPLFKYCFPFRNIYRLRTRNPHPSFISHISGK